jgi:hypothetical protein
MPRIPALVALTLALLTAGGCGTSQPPLVQVYAAKQAYAGSLDALTTLIQTGQISDRATLVKIRDTRAVIDVGLAEAERAARAGDLTSFRSWMTRVNAALETYLLLQAPSPTTRPVSLNVETPWTPSRSRPSSSPPARELPRWSALSTPSIRAAN